jgi:hypothetical protein
LASFFDFSLNTSLRLHLSGSPNTHSTALTMLAASKTKQKWERVPQEETGEDVPRLQANSGNSLESGASIYDAHSGNVCSPSGLRVFLTLLPNIYIPCFLFNLAGSVTDPVLPLFASHLGGSALVAGLVVSIDRLSSVVCSLPASLVFHRLGPSRTMALGALVGGAACAGAGASTSPVGLIGSLLVLGCGNALWKVSRATFIRMVTPPRASLSLSTDIHLTVCNNNYDRMYL